MGERGIFEFRGLSNPISSDYVLMLKLKFGIVRLNAAYIDAIIYM